MKKIVLENLIELSFNGEGGGSIDFTSLEREVCPFCEHPECRHSCDASQGEYSESDDEYQQVENDEEYEDRLIHNSCLDIIEFMTLALCNSLEQRGIVVDDNNDVNLAIAEAIETTMDTLGNVELPCANETSDYVDVNENGEQIIVENPPKELM